MATDDATTTDPGPHPEPEQAREKAAPTRSWFAGLLIAVLCALLGFALAVQLRTVDSDQGLAGAREEDLARILADLQSRQDRLRSEINEQQDLLEQLGSGEDSAAAAVEEARRQAEALAILNGTIAAEGPGLTITISDPDSTVDSAILLDAVQELRGAGAETMQVAGVRVGVSTALVGEAGDIRIDGIAVEAPYVIVAIGDGQTLSTAMQIPGGVEDKVLQAGASIDIVPADQVVVDALRPLDEPEYAEPAPDPDD
ncbi:MAG: DUF881 domain-containing protein [Actinomycetota bacterium]|jgi:uncharacterized protein YlxW (UPF0749 family)|nr:DUF881 domain-containing protein [Geodermatophilaceae bacterium]MDQ3053567.1 DUF881 domain-containing protein [Actinomycetota bacterium]